MSATDSLECTVKESTPKPGHLCDKHKATQGARWNVDGSAPNVTPPSLHPLDRLSEQQPSLTLAEFPKTQAANKAPFPTYIYNIKKHSWGGAYTPYLDSGPASAWTARPTQTNKLLAQASQAQQTSQWGQRPAPSSLATSSALPVKRHMLGVSLLPWQTVLIQHSIHDTTSESFLTQYFWEKSHQKATDGMCKHRHCHPSRLPCRSVDDLSAPDVEAQGTRHTQASGARTRHHLQQGERNHLGELCSR